MKKAILIILVLSVSCSKKEIVSPRMNAQRNSIQTVADTTFKLPVLKWKR